MPTPNRQQKNSLTYSGRTPVPRQKPIYGNAPTSNNVTTPPEKQINTLPVKNRDAQNIQQGFTSGSNRFQGKKGRERMRDYDRNYTKRTTGIDPFDFSAGAGVGWKGFGTGLGSIAKISDLSGYRARGGNSIGRRDGNAMRGYGPENTERRAERQRLLRNEKMANRSMRSGF